MNESQKYELWEKDYIRFKEELKKHTIEGTNFQPLYIKTGIVTISGDGAVANYGIICMRAENIDDFLEGKDLTVGAINKFDGKYTINTIDNSIKKILEQVQNPDIS